MTTTTFSVVTLTPEIVKAVSCSSSGSKRFADGP